ncbi:MAG: ATP-binding cassette domain-containing protein, partial [Bacteroidota bacterium]|nr:ATP-binding cassette domain-containing protein [Bacteroidota bacterium]
MIEIKNINKTFSDKKVLNDISTTFHEGKTNLIIGRSGSGKTVLLKTIAGLIEADSGSQIIYDNRCFTAMRFKERKELRKEIGMVFQFGALFDSMTVEENVRFPLDMFSPLNEKQKTKKVDFCLERVDIIGANKKFPAEISGGMKKRVAIARAIALNPRYLFCDEPNS